MSDTLIMPDHYLGTLIIDIARCLCRKTIHGGELRVVQIEDGLPVRESHIGCALGENAVTQAWVDKAIRAYCDQKNAGRRPARGYA